MDGPPIPDRDLAWRVGRHEEKDPLGSYDRYGRRLRDEVVGLLPDGWDWEGKRVLDFGCGAGRILRHFLDEARVAEFHGCDIDAPSIDWLRRHLSPPLRVAVNGEAPPLALDSSAFDLIYATSVFTHITDHWAAWLLELHRLLTPGGILIATFHGPGMYAKVTGAPQDEDRIGMNVLQYSQSWDEGGPGVLLSRWWIEAHWGRAFEILTLRPSGFASDSRDEGQGVAVMRRSRLRWTRTTWRPSSRASPARWPRCRPTSHSFTPRRRSPASGWSGFRARSAGGSRLRCARPGAGRIVI